MLTELVVLAPAPPDSRFVDDAFENAVGKQCRLTIGDGIVVEATVRSAQVFDRGRAATIRLEYDA